MLEDVPQIWADRLECLVRPVDDLQPPAGRKGLADDILRYVLTGAPLSILADVGRHDGVSAQLGVAGYLSRSRPTKADIYEHFSQVPPQTALRLARLLEASIGQSSHGLRMGLPGANWLEVLLVHSSGQGINTYTTNAPKPRGLTAAHLEALSCEAGLPSGLLLVTSFSKAVASTFSLQQRFHLVRDLPDFADVLECHLEEVRPHVLASQVQQRLHVLSMLGNAHSTTLDKLVKELCELATSGSKQVRGAAEPLICRCSDVVFSTLRKIAETGKPDQRFHALYLLHTVAKARSNSAEAAFAREKAAADKAATVQSLIAEWDGEIAIESEGPAAYEYTPPVIDWSVANSAIPQDQLRTLVAAINGSIEKANLQMREHHARMAAQGHRFPLHQQEVLSETFLDGLLAHLASDDRLPAGSGDRPAFGTQHLSGPLLALMSNPATSPVGAFKLLAYFGALVNHRGGLSNIAQRVFELVHQRTGRPTLLELSQMMDDAGLDGGALLVDYCNKYGAPLAYDWPNEHVWPFFAHHLDRVIQELTKVLTKDYFFDRVGLYRAIATLPSPPPTAINALYSLALAGGKLDREPAQQALQNHPNKEQRILEALADGKADTRATAARWLARLQYLPAIASLETAVAREKHDVAKGDMLDALESLGQSIEKYLDRESLAAEAAKSLDKGWPKDIDWFSWSTLPPVRWRDNLQTVPQQVIQWLIVQAVKQKQVEPNAILRKYCSMLEPRDREALGQFLLETWLHHDVVPISQDEAMKLALALAQANHASMQAYPQYYKDNPALNMSIEELTAAYFPSFAQRPAGSAIGSKGVLAVVAACAGERAAAPTQRYIKEWYGSRAGQGKALITMLAWIEHPSATQLMLAIGSRFRTKSFQEEATRQAEALAERKGWTLAELADRTVPTAGFDETGTMGLSYGDREFTAKMRPDFKVELFNPEGKKIASLPAPRQTDDAELAKESKKAFSSAKKELQRIAALQAERLYESLCTARTWMYGDWESYLHQHPVVRQLVQRLVWGQVDDGRVVLTFRPLEDGTLTDVEDNEVHLAKDALVCVAHDTILEPAEVQAWEKHLVDYEIKPLFQQFGKGVYELPESRCKDDEITDFKGHMIESFALRGRATKLGYTRGPAEDGGWFHVYTKRFPTLGLQASIEFTGSPLPEENRSVALLSLSFEATSSEGRNHGKLPLQRVPRVLLSECYNDCRMIAADGGGFDPDWEKKSEY
jgi:hypothetical protein